MREALENVMFKKNSNYLITTDQWFIAPDGWQYKAVWGEIKFFTDEALPIKTNRNSTNWYLQVGSEANHVIIAGCQIHYAILCENLPFDSFGQTWDDKDLDDNRFAKIIKHPTYIYIAGTTCV